MGKKAILKRFKITKTGKILRRKTGLNHYLAKKSGKRSRQSRKWRPLHPSEFKRIKKIINQ
ncbi:MAG: 50S ribosomal protein L35 [bacterium]|nr:50S ribosomal protein L35 [bacterium]